ncbi:MAG TPA: sn-glycerol-3-phosphate ABC transporter ATP-binding protein UgpC [Burkholderiales bacterium]|nr:sn-glycerol-3-phosphate ABC transporter ATP-binding protein UgpC [Burkholderiales bacterium]
MATVSLRSLSKKYPGGENLAVDSVSLEVAHGEFMVLLGPSGCGKSTTLRMVAGLESISDGELLIDGKRVNDIPAKDRDIAMVFQSYALYPHMTVLDNLAFGLRRRDFAAVEIERRVREVASTLGLSDFLKRKPHALSGGQRQRVALGRAIVRDPKVFLFDEPLSNLDAALRVGMRGELIKLHHRLGTTMIYVTHDQVEAMTMGDRICIMNGGKVAQIGAPLEVYARPADMFVASFLGSPPTNLIPGNFSASVLHVGESALAVPRRGKEDVIFGIRPEDIRIDGSAPHLHGEVLAVEPLGAETLLRVRLAGVPNDVMVRGPRTVRAAVGERVPLVFDLAAAHLFDPTSQQRI